jgi:hypothetical protein
MQDDRTGVQRVSSELDAVAGPTESVCGQLGDASDFVNCSWPRPPWGEEG